MKTYEELLKIYKKNLKDYNYYTTDNSTNGYQNYDGVDIYATTSNNTIEYNYYWKLTEIENTPQEEDIGDYEKWEDD